MKTVLVTLFATIALGFVVALSVVSSGLFNVAATVDDAPLLRDLLVRTREASISRHASDIEAPAVVDSARLDSGFRLYRDNCVICHTPIGRSPSPVARGLNPKAPRFDEHADGMSSAELFWVVKNGIRFTGMPAWEQSLDAQQMWDLVAFVVELPEMSAEDFEALDQRLPRSNLPVESQSSIAPSFVAERKAPVASHGHLR